MKSYKAIILATEGTLVGGVKRVESYAFENENDATQWADEVLRANLQAHRHPSVPLIKTVNHPNPIRHAEVS